MGLPVLEALPSRSVPYEQVDPYILVHEGRLVLIDLPQAVDLVGNPQGFEYLARDCANICEWFDARGIDGRKVLDRSRHRPVGRQSGRFV